MGRLRLSSKRILGKPYIHFILGKEYKTLLVDKTIKESTMGQYNFPHNVARVILPNIYKLTKYKMQGRDGLDECVEIMTEHICNTIIHESLHKAIKDCISNDTIRKLVLPITAQEWAVRSLLEEKNFNNLLGYVVEDMSLKFGVDLMFSDYLEKQVSFMTLIIAIYQFTLVFSIAFIKVLFVKFLLWGVHIGIVIWILYKQKMSWNLWKKKNLKDQKDSQGKKQ